MKHFRPYLRKIAPWSLGILIIGLTFATLTGKFARPAQAVWWDDYWGFRKPITFGNTGAADKNKKVKFDIDTAFLITNGQLQIDCDDVRFTDLNGKLLKYYLDSASGACNTTSTDLWVLVETIHSGNTVLYMYYDNPSAPAGTEGGQFSEATFSPTSGPTEGSVEKAPGPNGWWKFDEGTNNTCKTETNDACDSTAQMNDAAMTGGTWQAEDMCVSGKCMYFDGSDDVATITNAEALDFDLDLSTGVTFQAWVRANSDGEGDAGEIMEKGTHTYLRVTKESGGSADLEAKLDLATTDASISVSSGITLNQWHHVAFGYTDDGDDEITVYIDGIDRGSSTNGSGSPASDANNLLIGGSSDNNFKGFIDDFKVYKTERTAAQIKTDAVHGAGPHGASAVLGVQDTAFLNDGLVGYWKMDDDGVESEGETSTDSSGNGNNGTLYGDDGVGDNGTGMDCTAGGEFGTGCDFDGVDDYVNLGSADVFDNIGASTYTAWIKYDNADAGEEGVLGKSATYGSIIQLTDATGNISFMRWTDGPDLWVRTSNSSVSVGSWYHVAVTWDGTLNASGAHIYINGVETNYATQQDGSGNFGDHSGENLYIGARDATPSVSNPYEGLIDEVRIYNRALMPSEVEALYHWAPGPVGYWKMDENSGTSAYDSSGNSNTGTLTNMAAATDWVEGKYGSALDFDASNDYIGVSDHSTISLTTTGTVEAWIKTNRKYPSDDATTYYRSIVNKWSDGVCSANDEGYLMDWYGTNTTATFRGSICNGTVDPIIYSTTFTPGTWYHVVSSWDGTNQHLYINGVEVKSDTQDVNSQDDTTDVQIGCGYSCSSSLYAFDGAIDDVRIYNYARTAKQIIQDMSGRARSGSAGNATALLLYRFDEQSGTTAYDSGLAKTNAAISGATWKTQTDCKLNGCLDFDGSNDVVTSTITQATDLNLTLSSGHTFSSWIYVDSDGEGNEGEIFDKGTHTYMRITNESGSTADLEAKLDLATTDASISVSSGITLNQWHHVAMGYTDDTDDEITVYIDGVKRGTSTNGSGAPAADANDLLIGGSSSTNFDGKIDDFKLYAGELTEDEIRVDYNHGKAVVLGAKDDSNLNEGLVGWWKMDDAGVESEGEVTTDSSGRGNNGTLYGDDGVGDNGTGMDCTAGGQFGTGCDFDGTDDYVSVNHSTSLNLTSAMSFGVWIKPDFDQTYGSTRVVLDKTDNNGDAWRTQYQQNNWRFRLFTSGGAVNCDTQGLTWTTGTWHYLAGTHDGSNMKIYWDGKLNISCTQSGAITTNSVALLIGSFSDTSGYKFDGTIDDPRVYNRALSPKEVQDLYNWAPGPVGWWKMDENSGTSAYDSSGNANTGTLTNMSAATDWVEGKYGTGLDFDGVNDEINAGSNSSLDNLSEISITAWVKWEGNTDDAIIGKHLNSSTGWAFFASGSSKIYASINTDSTNAVSESSTPLTSGEWIHWAMTYSDSGDRTIRLYENGVESSYSSQTPATGTRGDDSALNLFLGARRSGNLNFNGIIDDVRIYNYARTPAQIMEDYSAGRATGPPVAWWKLDECSGTTAYNSAHNADSGATSTNNGLITIAATGSNTSAGTCGSGTTTEAWHNGTTGKRNGSLDFDGTDDLITLVDDSRLDFSSEMSVSAWIKHGAVSGTDTILEKFESTGSDGGYTLQMESDGDITFGIDDDNTSFPGDSVTSTAATYDDSAWHHVVGVKKGTSYVKLYIDGVLIGTDSSISEIGNLSNNDKLYIGVDGDGSSNPWDGQLDEMKLFNYALTPNEVRNEFNLGRAVRFGPSSGSP